MSTLREAVESGRRWRHRNWKDGHWHDAGRVLATEMLLLAEALSSDFEIEPERKPREWLIHIDPDGEVRRHQHNCGGEPLIRVHDADACDRLHREKR